MLRRNAKNNASRAFCRVGNSDFYATAIAAGEEKDMYLPVLSGRMCVWCGYVFNFRSNRSLSYINKQSQRMGCTVYSTVSKISRLMFSDSYNLEHGNTKLRQEFSCIQLFSLSAHQRFLGTDLFEGQSENKF